jgi:hypothetical protein
MIWMALIPMVMAAETAEEAEMQRLRDQMRQYQESGAVEYSDKVYLQMVKLDPAGAYLTDSDHMMGAMASSTRGDIQTTMNRLELCQSTDRAVQWRTFLWESTGSVSLKSIPNAEIVFMLGMLTPEQLAAVEFANNSLSNTGQFRGRLPNGAYQYGESHFVVSATGMMTSSDMKSKSTPERSPSFEGWDVLASPNVGTVLLGEGLRPDTGDTIPTTVLVNAGISGGVEVDLGDYYATFLPMVHLSRGDNINAWSIQPTGSVGQSVSEQFNVGIRGFGSVGYMTLVDVDYVKRTMGGGVGLEGRYAIQDFLSLHMFLDGGIMGSHTMVQAFVGLEYRGKVH